MKNFYVYILKCKNDSYYIGVTNNLERRLGEHNSAHSKTSYISKRLPLELVYSQQFNDIDQAIALEKQLKGWSRKKKHLLRRTWKG